MQGRILLAERHVPNLPYRLLLCQQHQNTLPWRQNNSDWLVWRLGLPVQGARQLIGVGRLVLQLYLYQGLQRPHLHHGCHPALQQSRGMCVLWRSVRRYSYGLLSGSYGFSHVHTSLHHVVPRLPVRLQLRRLLPVQGRDLLQRRGC